MPSKEHPRKKTSKKTLSGGTKGNTKKTQPLKKPVKKSVGKNGVPTPKTPKPFSKTHQPSNAVKQAGWDRKKLLKDMLGLTTNGKFPDKKDYRKLASQYLGINEEDVTIKMVMDFKQIEKAITKGDTFAYVAVNDRAFGKPTQEIQLPPGSLFGGELSDEKFNKLLKAAGETKTSSGK